MTEEEQAAAREAAAAATASSVRKKWTNHGFMAKKTTQAPKLSMGGCRTCKAQLWRDMTEAHLQKHYEGRCVSPLHPPTQ